MQTMSTNHQCFSYFNVDDDEEEDDEEGKEYSLGESDEDEEGKRTTKVDPSAGTYL